VNAHADTGGARAPAPTGLARRSPTGPAGRATAGLARRAPAMLARRSSWVVLAVLVAALLAAGSVHSGPTTRADRIDYLESVIKCPVCEDVSIAASDAQSARNLRAEVVQLVDSGRSNAAIESYVVAQYGTDELLRPANVVLWVLPVAGCALAAVILAVALLRRRSRADGSEADAADEALVAAALRRSPP